MPDLIPAVAIPEVVQAGFRKFEQLTDEAYAELLRVLQEEQAELDPRSFSARLSNRIKTIEPGDVQEIFDTLVSFVAGSITLGLSHGDFIEAIIKGDPDLTEAEQGIIRQRLSQVLQTDSLLMTAKALDILTDQPNSFVGARILTDVRPIFHDDPDTAPIVALLIHTLKVTYHSKGKHEDFYVALNIEDLKRLRKIIDRAEAKANNLTALLSKMELRLIPREDE